MGRYLGWRGHRATRCYRHRRTSALDCAGDYPRDGCRTVRACWIGRARVPSRGGCPRGMRKKLSLQQRRAAKRLRWENRSPEQRVRKRETNKAWEKMHPGYNKAWRIANWDRVRAQQVAYAASHAIQARVWKSAWAQRNPEAVAAKNKRWREANKERKRITTAAWTAKNQERKKATNAAWEKSHPDAMAAKSARRRVAKSASPVECFSPQEIYERDHWRCRICGGLAARWRKHRDPFSATLDHVVPLVKGGPHTRENVQLAHMACNSRKGAA